MTPSAKFSKHLERSGLTIVRLTDCNFNDAVSCYAKLQKSNPLFIKLGIVGSQLQKYAEFVIKNGLKFSFNIVAIDNNSGRIEGIFISVIVSEVLSDDSELSDGARMHWRTYHLCDKVMREHVHQYNKLVVSVLIAWMPKHQGKGLFVDMATTLGDLCADVGIDGFAAFTANPNFLRAYQNMVSPGTKLPKEIAEKLLESRPSIVNNELLPKYRKDCIIPNDLELRSVDFATLTPLTRNIPFKNYIVMAGPTPTTEYIARSKLQSRL